MTFVGKILVILIMIFAVVFMAISTVVFTTSTNWKAVAEKKSQEVKSLQTKVTTLTGDVTTQQGKLADAVQKQKTDLDGLTKQINDLKSERDSRQKEIEQQRTAVEKSQENSKLAMDEAEKRVKETETLRGLLKSVQDQANEYKLRQTELNDEIRILKREFDTAVKNNSDLRERTAVFQAKLKSLGQAADFEQLKGVAAPPPDVEGEVDRVSPDNRRIEVTIGSDDGLVVGHEFLLFRLGADPKFLSKVKIISVDPHRAVAEVIGKTVRGEKIQEHDIVATKSGRGASAGGRQAATARAASRPTGGRVLVQAPKSDIYVAMLGIALGAIVLGCLLLFLVWNRYDMKTKATVLNDQAPVALALA